MSGERKKGRGGFIILCVVVFVVAFAISLVAKLAHKPAWSKKYSVEWSDKIGTMHTDLVYGDNPANKFDLYLPADNTKQNYGLVVYLHAGGFTTGDKSDDKAMLQWLCSKGYVAAGINYTLRDEAHPNASVLSQSQEIRESMTKVVAEAARLGYNVNQMAISGGSAGGTLAMLYAYRDADTSPVPVKLLFEAVGPSSFFAEDWGVYGLDKNDEAAAGLFSVMSGKTITEQMIASGNYQNEVKDISGWAWVNANSVPTVIAYGKHDKVCPFDTVKHLVKALESNGVKHEYFELPHSGHALQNDDKIYQQYMDTVNEYLEKYLPVGK